MAKIGLEFVGFEKVLQRLKSLEADTKKIAEDALTKTHSIVTSKAEQGMAAGNLPAGGKYSKGQTLASLQRTPSVEWQGDVGVVPVGFNIQKGGLASIFLMYGTPRMKKDQALYNAFYSNSTKTEIVEAQEEIFYAALRELEG